MYTFVCTIRSNVGSPAVSVWVTHPAARISTRYGTDRFHAGANIRMRQTKPARQQRSYQQTPIPCWALPRGAQLNGAGAHRITLRADNITGVTYRDHLFRIDRSKVGFPMPGRIVSLGYRYTF